MKPEEEMTTEWPDALERTADVAGSAVVAPLDGDSSWRDIWTRLVDRTGSRKRAALVISAALLGTALGAIAALAEIARDSIEERARKITR